MTEEEKQAGITAGSQTANPEAADGRIADAAARPGEQTGNAEARADGQMANAEAAADAEVKAAVRQMSELMANMYYFLTKAVIEDFGAEAKSTIERGITEFGLDRGRKIAEKAREAGDELTIENLDKHYDMPITKGWDLHRSYGNAERKNITDSCSFAEIWKEKGWEEIGHCYCLVDEAIRRGYNPHVVFKPVRNILLGDDCCESLTVYE